MHVHIFIIPTASSKNQRKFDIHTYTCIHYEFYSSAMIFTDTCRLLKARRKICRYVMKIYQFQNDRF